MASWLILLRHGDYEGESLTPLGKKQIACVASQILNLNNPVHKILSSPLKRAMETAEILQEQTDAPVIVEPYLYDFDASRLIDEIEKEKLTLMVGHAPDLPGFLDLLVEKPIFEKFNVGEGCLVKFEEKIAPGNAIFVKRFN